MPMFLMCFCQQRDATASRRNTEVVWFAENEPHAASTNQVPIHRACPRWALEFQCPLIAPPPQPGSNCHFSSGEPTGAQQLIPHDIRLSCVPSQTCYIRIRWLSTHTGQLQATSPNNRMGRLWRVAKPELQLPFTTMVSGCMAPGHRVALTWIYNLSWFP